ncbi:hypothetical protein [Erwinia rhapontici]|uniref:hypothetical protein n=1 Tax=Erwinia rhapontici TaxID=55212 RepID=UPI001BB3BB7F|nr:hypothetical protein [Erwinia rhapontici]MCS3607240.1 hypothetical protein [Erwinia rhapontici]BCQ38578.1 hypothetical protein ERHA54_11810 [Erwinia rhapontici]
MLIKMLPADKKALLVELARLLALSDNPLLWDGKTKDKLRSDSDLNNLTIQKDALETELLEEMEQHSPGFSAPGVFGGFFSMSAEKKLIEKLKTYPLSIIDAPETRIQAATAVLKTLLEHQIMENITTPKVIIFQLFLVALRDGQISSIEWMLLKEIQLAFKVPDFIFKDLLDHAESLNNEMSKLLALILE